MKNQRTRSSFLTSVFISSVGDCACHKQRMTDVGGTRDYASFDWREWERLETSQGRIEFEITTHLLAKTLPKSGNVLDIGGGPGRYSRWLYDMGYQATLADLSPNLLDIARAEFGEELIREIVEADVQDLSRWPANTFDSTIALGPFYHLTSADDRRRALEEHMRVTVPGGTIAIALMSKYALLRRTLAVRDERHRMADTSNLEAVLSHGTYFGTSAPVLVFWIGQGLVSYPLVLRQWGFEIPEVNGVLLVFVSEVPCMGCPKLPEPRRSGLSGLSYCPGKPSTSTCATPRWGDALSCRRHSCAVAPPS